MRKKISFRCDSCEIESAFYINAPWTDAEKMLEKVREDFALCMRCFEPNTIVEDEWKWVYQDGENCLNENN